MENILPAFLAILAGLTGLVWGADRFVAGSAGAAKNLGVSPLVIGLTVVSIGTSAPEILVSVSAALRGVGQLAVGNAIGSNLANIGLVLGVTALIAPLPTQRHLLIQEGPLLLLVTGLIGLILFDGNLQAWESAPFLVAVPLLLWATVRYKKHHPSPEAVEEGEALPRFSMAASLWWLGLGLAVLLVGAEVLVWGATLTARHLGVSELVIGLTVVAIGTSLPELAASVASALRGHHDIAIGNVFGSNLFNLMLVLPLAGVIDPKAMEAEVFSRDFVALALLTLLLYAGIAAARRRGGSRTLTRPKGLLLLVLYVGYCLWLIPAARLTA